ncbi:hypothetical protein Godav_001537, partial [Gossypium davidsonii]|nr:hypothetical protein [Gossypium davidsonii]
MLQSCNGLFLCEPFDYYNDRDLFYTTYTKKHIVCTYFICNPTTKKFKRLSFPTNPIIGFESYVSLAFDPRNSTHYKSIVVRQASENSCTFEMDIYASETDRWKVSPIVFQVEPADRIAFEDVVFCNDLQVLVHAFELDVHEMATDYPHWFLKHQLFVGDSMEVYPELELCPFSPGFSGVSFVGSDEAKI